MKNTKDRIYISEWLKLKPYKKHTGTDNYYLKLSNELKQSIISNDKLDDVKKYLDDTDLDVLCCILISYFEDLITGTNIWNSFIRLHKRLYGVELPFYDISDYDDEEINSEDLSFLVWYFFNTLMNSFLFNPYSDFIIETSKVTMILLEREWEFAPENEQLKACYFIDENEEDFYKARKFLSLVFLDSYLFHIDTLVDYQISNIEIIEEYKEDENLTVYLNDNKDVFLNMTCSNLLALNAKEWAAEILGHDHKLSKEFLKITTKILGYFLYKGQDDENIFIEHIASGKKFDLTKKSFDNYTDLINIDSILHMGIIRWKDEWWFSGTYFQIDFDANLVLDEKKSIISRSVVNFLDYENKDVRSILKEQRDAFMQFNSNQEIALMKTNEIDSFVTDYMEYYNNFLNLSDNQESEASERAKKEGLINVEKSGYNFTESPEKGLVYFNPISGIEVALNVNKAFPTEDLSSYDEEESEEAVLSLLSFDQYSTELAKYCVNNFKDKLPIFKTKNGELLINNLDFLLRYWKKANYHTHPSISLIGKDSQHNNYTDIDR